MGYYESLTPPKIVVKHTLCEVRISPASSHSAQLRQLRDKDHGTSVLFCPHSVNRTKCLLAKLIPVLNAEGTSLCLWVSGAFCWLTQPVSSIPQAESCFQPGVSTKSVGAPVPASNPAGQGYESKSCNNCSETCRRSAKFCLADFPLYSKGGCVCPLGGLTLIWQSKTPGAGFLLQLTCKMGFAVLWLSWFYLWQNCKYLGYQAGATWEALSSASLGTWSCHCVQAHKPLCKFDSDFTPSWGCSSPLWMNPPYLGSQYGFRGLIIDPLC